MRQHMRHPRLRQSPGLSREIGCSRELLGAAPSKDRNKNRTFKNWQSGYQLGWWPELEA
jgi:hypothetical protein